MLAPSSQQNAEIHASSIYSTRHSELVSRFTWSPAVVAQTWRGGPRQARLARLLNAEEVHIEPLDAHTARAVGELRGRQDTTTWSTYTSCCAPGSTITAWPPRTPATSSPSTRNCRSSCSDDGPGSRQLSYSYSRAPRKARAKITQGSFGTGSPSHRYAFSIDLRRAEKLSR